MKKTLLALSLLATSAVTQAYEIDTEACAGEEYIYDEQGVIVKYDPAVHTFVTEETPVYYAGRATVPHLRMTSTDSRANHIYITNTSNSYISFFYKPTFFDESNGDLTNLNIETYYGEFSSTNNPRNAAGATMAPLTHGRINTGTGAAVFANALLEWDSSTCLSSPPVLASSETYYVNSNRFGMSVHLINEGKPF